MASFLVGLRFSSPQDIRGSAAAFAARTRSGRVVTWGHRQFGGRMGGSIWASCHHEIPYIPMLMARNNIFTMKLVLFFGISIIVIDIRLKFPGGPTICHLYYVKPSLIKVYLLVVWNMNFMTFHFIYGNVIFPTDELHHFSRWLLHHQPSLIGITSWWHMAWNGWWMGWVTSVCQLVTHLFTNRGLLLGTCEWDGLFVGFTTYFGRWLLALQLRCPYTWFLGSGCRWKKT